ncbi:MAG: hypothetical protein WA996_15400 [Candidatus Promineifilaceae bacterium]
MTIFLTSVSTRRKALLQQEAAVIVNLLRVDDTRSKYFPRGFIVPGGDACYIMNACLNGIVALASLLWVFLVVGDYVFNGDHCSLARDVKGLLNQC